MLKREIFRFAYLVLLSSICLVFLHVCKKLHDAFTQIYGVKIYLFKMTMDLNCNKI